MNVDPHKVHLTDKIWKVRPPCRFLIPQLQTKLPLRLRVV